MKQRLEQRSRPQPDIDDSIYLTDEAGILEVKRGLNVIAANDPETYANCAKALIKMRTLGFNPSSKVAVIGLGTNVFGKMIGHNNLDSYEIERSLVIHHGHGTAGDYKVTLPESRKKYDFIFYHIDELPDFDILNTALKPNGKLLIWNEL